MLNCPTCWIYAIEHAHQTSHTHDIRHTHITAEGYDIDRWCARARWQHTHLCDPQRRDAHIATHTIEPKWVILWDSFYFILAHLLSSSLHRRLNRTKQHVLRGTRGYRVRTGKVARWLEIDATKGTRKYTHTHIELMIWCIWMGTSNLVLCT